MKTETNLPFNVSWKAVLAFVFPAIATTVAAGIGWLATGEFDVWALRVGLAGYATSALAAIGAYLGAPGAVGFTPQNLPGGVVPEQRKHEDHA
jgi:hypothetical protein